jgi:hypothetical protein
MSMKKYEIFIIVVLTVLFWVGIWGAVDTFVGIIGKTKTQKIIIFLCISTVSCIVLVASGYEKYIIPHTHTDSGHKKKRKRKNHLVI